MEATPGVVPGLRQEGSAVEEEEEELQAMRGRQVAQLRLRARQLERRRQVDFEELFRAGTGVLPVQAPDRTVGQDAPLHAAVRHHVGAAQVAKHLRRGCAGVETIGRFAAIERAAPTLGFEDGQAMPIAALVAALLHRKRHVLRACEEQAIRHVFAALRRHVHLRQGVFAPAELKENAADQLLLGLGFVESGRGAERCQRGQHRRAKALEGFVAKLLPWGRGLDAAFEKVLGEELALHRWGLSRLRECSEDIAPA
jgi:hypothetical protein